MMILEIILGTILALLVCLMTIFPAGYVCLIQPIREKNSKRNFPEWWNKLEKYEHIRDLSYEIHSKKIAVKNEIEEKEKYYPISEHDNIEQLKRKYKVYCQEENNARLNARDSLYELRKEAKEKKIYNTVNFSLEITFL